MALPCKGRVSERNDIHRSSMAGFCHRGIEERPGGDICRSYPHLILLKSSQPTWCWLAFEQYAQEASSQVSGHSGAPRSGSRRQGLSTWQDCTLKGLGASVSVTDGMRSYMNSKPRGKLIYFLKQCYELGCVPLKFLC